VLVGGYCKGSCRIIEILKNAADRGPVPDRCAHWSGTVPPPLLNTISYLIGSGGFGELTEFSVGYCQ